MRFYKGSHVADGEFLPFPEEWVPKPPAILQAFLEDYNINKDVFRREQAALLSNATFAIDHQCKVVKRVKKKVGELVCQTFSNVGDLGLVLSFCVVHNIGEHWTELAIEEVVQ